jgi:hypothetical protein
VKLIYHSTSRVQRSNFGYYGQQFWRARSRFFDRRVRSRGWATGRRDFFFFFFFLSPFWGATFLTNCFVGYDVSSGGTAVEGREGRSWTRSLEWDLWFCVCVGGVPTQTQQLGLALKGSQVSAVSQTSLPILLPLLSVFSLSLLDVCAAAADASVTLLRIFGGFPLC